MSKAKNKNYIPRLYPDKKRLFHPILRPIALLWTQMGKMTFSRYFWDEASLQEGSLQKFQKRRENCF